MWVIDTDVIVAAVRSRTGASAELLRTVLRDQVEIGLSVALAIEYEAVATREEHLRAGELSERDALILIDTLISVAKSIDTSFRWRPQLRDPDDEMVLEAAVNGGAEAIVTFNRKDFIRAASDFGLGLLLPREALEKLR
jgi:putative PIN family toxin of toxin-antitoxin system